jgi:hypothetical protein
VLHFNEYKGMKSKTFRLLTESEHEDVMDTVKLFAKLVDRTLMRTAVALWMDHLKSVAEVGFTDDCPRPQWPHEIMNESSVRRAVAALLRISCYLRAMAASQREHPDFPQEPDPPDEADWWKTGSDIESKRDEEWPDRVHFCDECSRRSTGSSGEPDHWSDGIVFKTKYTGRVLLERIAEECAILIDERCSVTGGHGEYWITAIRDLLGCDELLSRYVNFTTGERKFPKLCPTEQWWQSALANSPKCTDQE